MDYKIKSKELENLANLKFNREKEKIEVEIESKLKQIMRTLAQRGILYSGYMFKKALEIHKERIERLLNSRLEIDLEVFYRDLSIETDDDINFLYERIKQIANRQREIILSNVEPILQGMNQIDKFREEINREIDNILADIKRSLIIKREENILLSKKKIKEANLNSEKSILKEFEYLLESIENEKLKKILLRDFKHAIFCLENKLWKPCVVLCGGILEGVFNIEFGMDKMKRNGKTVEMRLEDMIKEARKREILSKKQDEDLAHTLRAFRNYIHIKREMKEEHSLEDTDANISVQVVIKIFREIKKFKEKELLKDLHKIKNFDIDLLKQMKETGKGVPITAFDGLIRRRRKEFDELIKSEILLPCSFEESTTTNPEIQAKAIELKSELNCHEAYKLSEKGFKLLEKIDSQGK